MTHIKNQDIDGSIITFVQSDFTDSLETLYLMSLEALKNACVEDYDSLLGYKNNSAEQISSTSFQQSLLPELDLKRENLTVFADGFGLTSANVTLIAKGKWYLYWYLHYTNPKIKVLKDVCRNGDITQCRSCKVGNYNDCLFKTKQTKHNIGTLYFDMLNFIDESECNDIIEVLQTLH